MHIAHVLSYRSKIIKIRAGVKSAIPRCEKSIAEYTLAMEDGTDGLILVDIQDNAKEAGQRLRASLNRMRAKGVLDNGEYRQLETRLTVALTMVEGV